MKLNEMSNKLLKRITNFQLGAKIIHNPINSDTEFLFKNRLKKSSSNFLDNRPVFPEKNLLEHGFII